MMLIIIIIIHGQITEADNDKCEFMFIYAIESNTSLCLLEPDIDHH